MNNFLIRIAGGILLVVGLAATNLGCDEFDPAPQPIVGTPPTVTATAVQDNDTLNLYRFSLTSTNSIGTQWTFPAAGDLRDGDNNRQTEVEFLFTEEGRYRVRATATGYAGIAHQDFLIEITEVTANEF